MTKLERKLKAALRRLGLVEAPSLLIAVSGGADSISLLDALMRLKNHGKLPARISVAHLNHQLREKESDEDEDFVFQLARQNDLECFIERCAVAEITRGEKGNLEATARRLRYDFLARAAQACGAGVVLTAHIQDDQAETILMRLLRGTSAEGLRGILPIRELEPSVKLMRPMLAVTRAEVIEHCEQHQLKFRTDSSNNLPDFTRNRIRQELLPLMQSFNPRSNEALARFAWLLSEDQEVLQQISLQILSEVQQKEGLNAGKLREQAPAIRRRVLRLWLEQRRGLQRIDAVHLQAVEQLILRNHGGRIIELPANWRVTLKSGVLIVQCLGQMS